MYRRSSINRPRGWEKEGSVKVISASDLRRARGGESGSWAVERLLTPPVVGAKTDSATCFVA